MKLKTIGILSISAIILLFITFESVLQYVKLQKDYKRIQDNAVTMRDSLTYYKDSKGREVAQLKTVEYKADELKKLVPDVPVILKELNVKTKRVESFAQTEVQQEKQITAPVHDTIIKNVNGDLKAKYFHYRDAWYDIKGIWQDTTAKLIVSSKDTIIQVISFGPRIHPWLWIFSRRDLVQTIQSRNPSNHIVFARYIKIKK
ncbi:MAG: DUF6549 family protein [Bacteroidota bacterium]